MTDGSARIEDASPDSWVYRRAPAPLRPWLQLMRADRPIGAWLLLLPCWQGLALAVAVEGWRSEAWWLFAAFAVGAYTMRGAGCAFNDVVDRDFDRQVQRTRNRPVASGAIGPKPALLFALALCIPGLLVLLTMHPAAILLGLLAVIPAAVYPFTKRFTHLPQAVLGIAFNWGALLGWTAYTGSLSWPPLALYLGSVFWTLGYDTVYAAMDLRDDPRAGVKSTARLFGRRLPRAVLAAYGMTIALVALAGHLAGLGLAFWFGLGVYAVHLLAPMPGLIRRWPDVPSSDCLALFKRSQLTGLLLVAAFLADSLLPTA